MCILIFLCGCSSSSASDRKAKCEKILESKYGKDYTVSKIYGGDYSGVYYGEAYPNENPGLVFSFSNNMNSESTESWSDEYEERIKGEEYREDIAEILGGVGFDFYTYIRYSTVGDSKDSFFFRIYISNQWLSISDVQLWDTFKEIAKEYSNYGLYIVLEEDLKMIRDEINLDGKLSEESTREYEEKYDRIIVTSDNREDFFTEMEEVRNNELFN